jgi:hypothetical protein
LNNLRLAKAEEGRLKLLVGENEEVTVEDKTDAQ